MLERLSLADLNCWRSAPNGNRPPLPLTGEARERLLEMADGDGRAALNLIEQVMAWKLSAGGDGKLDTQAIVAASDAARGEIRQVGDEHLQPDLGLHKSVRGSGPRRGALLVRPDAGGGEDPRYLARRLTRMARSRISAWPTAAPASLPDAWALYERLSSPRASWRWRRR